MTVGACKLPLGASCLVVLGHLVSCYAQDFAPVPALIEAYLGLLSLTSSLASKEHCSAKPGMHYLQLNNPGQISKTATPGYDAAKHSPTRTMMDLDRKHQKQGDVAFPVGTLHSMN